MKIGAYLYKNGSSSPKICPRAKLTFTDFPKVWAFSFPNVDRNGKLVSAIIKKWKKITLAPQKYVSYSTTLNYCPPKFGLVIDVGHYEKM